MLKRQRPSSPPVPSTSFSDVPLITDSPGDLIERNSKRRRTAPPVLDGAVRGWAPPQQNDDQDQDEEDYTDDPTDGAPYANYTTIQSAASEYKSANTVLRELHTLHQHRLLFTPTSSSSGGSNILMNAATAPQHSAPHPRHPTPEKGLSSWPHAHLDQMHPMHLIERAPQIDGVLMEEATRVAERYEGLNKVLGSYVLSRRRELHSSDQIPGTQT